MTPTTLCSSVISWLSQFAGTEISQDVRPSVLNWECLQAKWGKLVPIHLADLGRMARTYAGTHGGTFLTHSVAHGILRHWLRKLVLTLALLAGRGCELSRVGSQLRRGFLTLKKAELISGDAFSSLHLSPYTHLCCVLASVRKTKCDLNNPGPIGHSVT